MAIIGTDITRAASLLKQGELVAIPTETVYGLAANALDAIAVSKIFAVKNRPNFNPLIVHCHSIEQAQQFGAIDDPRIRLLAKKFWPGPLTIIAPKKEEVPDIVTAGFPFVGIRVPQHPLTLELLQHLDFPLAAPSANPFGYISPTSPAHVNEQLGDLIPYILDGGISKVGIESTIVSFAEKDPVLLRFGGISPEQIQQVIGNITVRGENISAAPLSPGQLASHYAPHKKLKLGNLSDLMKLYQNQPFTVISFSKSYDLPAGRQFILSPKGDLQEAARNIFRVLRDADKTTVDLILAEPVPDVGLGRAINDRLKRASA